MLGGTKSTATYMDDRKCRYVHEIEASSSFLIKNYCFSKEKAETKTISLQVCC